MKRPLLALVAALMFGATGVAAAGPVAVDDHLYRVLGGQAGIASLMHDLTQRLFADPRIGHFFEHTKPAGLADSLTEQVCALSGGPLAYKGAKMGPAHADLGIARGDFNRLVELLQDTMDAHGVPFHEQNVLLAMLAPMYRDVVTR